MPCRKKRKCRRCGVLKDSTAYWAAPRKHGNGGRSGKQAKKSYTCRKCFNRREAERNKQLERWLKFGRDCPRCGRRTPCPAEIGTSHNAICHACNRQRRRENARDRYHRNPEASRAAGRAWRAANPGKAAASTRAWRARVTKDPKVKLRLLEDKRISEKLNAELKGKPLVTPPRETRMPGGPELVVEPLVAVVTGYLERGRHEWAEDFNEAVALEAIGIVPKSYYEWKRGMRRYVRFDLADRILAHADWNWFDVWTECELPSNGHKNGQPLDVLRYIDGVWAYQGYAEAHLAFTGERLVP